MWFRIMATLLLCCLCAAFASAQTAGELRQKFGEPTEGKFLVRPHISAAQFYSKQLQACVIKIQLEAPPLLSGESDELLPPEIADEVINELAPLEKRGKLSGTNDAEWGRNGEITSIYEKVTIRRHTLGPKRWYRDVSIEWKANRCQ